MQIGTVIRKYRKEKEMTQEEMAGYLGVTAPAVNKWESGASCPDITLLAPIARLLQISTDTLLSYKEELTREEIGMFANKISETMQRESFEAAYKEAVNVLREYPNCELLILTVASILDSYRVIGEQKEVGKYEAEITSLFERAMKSADTNIKQGAIIALFNKCLQKEEYEKAQAYLDKIEKQLNNPDRYQALLYARCGKTEEAYELYERLVMAGFSELSWALNGIYELETEKKDFETAEKIVEKQERLAQIMDMGKYSSLAPRFGLAQAKKDKDAWFKIAGQLIDSVKEFDIFKNSVLYRHIKFKDGADTDMVMQMLKKGFEKDTEIDFLKTDRRFSELMEKLSTQGTP